MGKRLGYSNGMLLHVVCVIRQDVSKHNQPFTVSCSLFSSIGRTDCTHLQRYQSIEANHYLCSPDALNMDALNL